MSGKQAKLLTSSMVAATMKHVQRKRYPVRDKTIILLSVKAGLRAGEISKLTWPMVLDANGKIGDTIELHDIAAKKLHGRTIPINPELRKALVRLHRLSGHRHRRAAIRHHAADARRSPCHDRSQAGRTAACRSTASSQSAALASAAADDGTEKPDARDRHHHR